MLLFSGNCKALKNLKLCQFSANFLLVEGSVSEPRIHLLVGEPRSGSVVKAMKYSPFADFFVPTSSFRHAHQMLTNAIFGGENCNISWEYCYVDF